MFILPKVFYRFDAITVKMPIAFFIEMEKNPKIVREPLNAWNSQNSLGAKRTKMEALHYFKNVLQISKIETAWNWHRNRLIDQRDRIQSSEINPYPSDV
jgi:hypothetical protein